MTEPELRENIDKYQAMLYRLSYSITGSAAGSEDTVWEAFMRLYLKKIPFRTEDDKKAWLIRVTVNLCISELRRRKRISPEELTDIPADSPDRESIIMLRDALLKLKPAYRAVIHLHYYEGRSAEEISRCLKISVTAVTTRLQRGRAMLRELMEE